MQWLLGGVFLGWSLGANAAANVFGTAVTSKMIKFWKAGILAAIFVVLGSVLEGAAGMETLSGLTTQTLVSSFVSALSAALVVTIATVAKLPTSVSQAVVGAIIGKGMYSGGVQWGGLTKVVLCWIGTPIGAMLISGALYLVIQRWVRRTSLSILTVDTMLRYGLVVVGCYGAYALGANNVANVTGVFLGQDKELGVLAGALWLSAIGGVAIALGIVTYGHRVMLTVGSELVSMNSQGAFVAVVAHSVTIHIFAVIGVPVSSSQAIVGGVLGIALVKGGQTVKFKVLRDILIGWVSVPVATGLLSYLICRIFSIR
ncbi:MAG: anion permease [Myxococcales bacterium]|nr:anion permease [Myxococcales bacterium]